MMGRGLGRGLGMGMGLARGMGRLMLYGIGRRFLNRVGGLAGQEMLHEGPARQEMLQEYRERLEKELQAVQNELSQNRE